MPWFPNPNGGPPIQADTNPNPAGGSYGYYSEPGYNGPAPNQPTSGGGASVAPSYQPLQTQNAGGGDLEAITQSIISALATGNKAAFDESVRQFNAQFGLDQQKYAEAIRQYNATLAEQQRQFNESNALQAANLTGFYNPPGSQQQGTGTGNLAMDAFNTKASAHDQQTYLQATGGDRNAAANRYWTDVQGAISQAGMTPQQFVYGMAAPASGAPATGQGTPTLANILQQANLSGIYNGQPTEARRQFDVSTGLNAAQLAGSLHADPFRQAQVEGQLGRLLQGQGVAGFQSPTGSAADTSSIDYILNQIRGGANNPAQYGSAQGVLDQIPAPNQVNAHEFFQASPGTQNLILSGLKAKYGLDPENSLAQIKATLPQFTSPSLTGAVRI